MSDGDALRIGDVTLPIGMALKLPKNTADSGAERPSVIDVLPAPHLHLPPVLPPQVTDVGRMARDLNALFKVANAINSQRDLSRCRRDILQFIFEVVPARSRRHPDYRQRRAGPLHGDLEA